VLKSVLQNEDLMKNSIFIPVALVAAFLIGGCSRSSKKGAGGAPVLVAQAVATNVPVQIDPPPVGHVTPYTTVTIRPQIGGVISQVHFQEGQEVRKGDLLFTIDPRPTQAALATARANLARDQAQLENARIQFNREQKLFEQKLISQDEYDTSRASLDALTGTVAADQAVVTNATLNLEFTGIRAPFDGRTGSLQFHEGNVVKAPDDTLLTINQIHPIYVAFGVLEQYLPEIKREMRDKALKVAVTFQNMDVPPPQGELTFVDNTVDPTTGLIQFKATFPNEDSVLWPGQFVQVTLTLSDLTNAIVVPSQAVQTGQNGEFVYVVKTRQTPGEEPERIVEERPVTIGIMYQGETVVQSGLKAGETVVTDGQLRLEPGVKVSVKSAIQPAAPTNSTENVK
jgi:multidrug efflux system membrane fusion protein